jgi:hypothetical protein
MNFRNARPILLAFCILAEPLGAQQGIGPDQVSDPLASEVAAPAKSRQDQVVQFLTGHGLLPALGMIFLLQRPDTTLTPIQIAPLEFRQQDMAFFAGAGLAHDPPAMNGVPLPAGKRGVAIRVEFGGGKGPRVRQVRVQGQDQGWAFLHDPHASVPTAVNAAFVSFRLSEPALQIEIVLRPSGHALADEQTRFKTGHHLAHVTRNLVSAALKLPP